MRKSTPVGQLFALLQYVRKKKLSETDVVKMHETHFMKPDAYECAVNAARAAEGVASIRTGAAEGLTASSAVLNYIYTHSCNYAEVLAILHLCAVLKNRKARNV